MSELTRIAAFPCIDASIDRCVHFYSKAVALGLTHRYDRDELVLVSSRPLDGCQQDEAYDYVEKLMFEYASLGDQPDWFELLTDSQGAWLDQSIDNPLKPARVAIFDTYELNDFDILQLVTKAHSLGLVHYYTFETNTNLLVFSDTLVDPVYMEWFVSTCDDYIRLNNFRQRPCLEVLTNQDGTWK